MYKPEDIRTIHIKNSPCCNCAKRLIKYFEDCQQRPTIYIGQIWRLHDSEDKEWLKAMLKKGFNVTVWDELHNKIYSENDSTTKNYLEDLYNNL